MTEAVRERVHALWDQLASFGGAGCDEVLLQVLGSLAELVEASNGYWLAAVRMQSGRSDDPAAGWRPRSIEHLHARRRRAATYEEHRRRLEAGVVDPCLAANLSGAGRFRVTVQSELVPPQWYASEHYRTLFAAVGVRDVLHSAMPLGEDLECWLCFERLESDPPRQFGSEERQTLEYAVRPLGWFHRKLLLHRGIGLAQAPLTDSERRVLDHLLSDRTEPEIAAELHLSPSTVRTYAARIYGKFNVRGRAGLMALWLGAS